MLDVKLIRKQPDLVRKGLADKGESGEALEWFLQRDKEWVRLVAESEKLVAEQNRLQGEIDRKRSKGEDGAAEVAAKAELKARHKPLADQAEALKADLQKLLMRLPNLAAADVPVGDADANRVESTWGDETKFDFKAKAHWDLGTALKAFDADAAGRISGSGFSVMSGGLAQL
jgi:seryl-tRNA synthetase